LVDEELHFLRGRLAQKDILLKGIKSLDLDVASRQRTDIRRWESDVEAAKAEEVYVAAELQAAEAKCDSARQHLASKRGRVAALAAEESQLKARLEELLKAQELRAQELVRAQELRALDAARAQDVVAKVSAQACQASPGCCSVETWNARVLQGVLETGMTTNTTDERHALTLSTTTVPPTCVQADASEVGEATGPSADFSDCSADAATVYCSLPNFSAHSLTLGRQELLGIGSVDGVSDIAKILLARTSGSAYCINPMMKMNSAPQRHWQFDAAAAGNVAAVHGR